MKQIHVTMLMQFYTLTVCCALPHRILPYTNVEHTRIIAEQLSLLNKILMRHTLNMANRTDVTVNNLDTASNTVQIIQQGPERVTINAPAAPPVPIGPPKPLTLWEKVKGWFKGTKKIPPVQDNSVFSYLSSNKQTILLNTAVAGYLYSNYRLLNLSHYLQAPNRWSLWKQHMPLSQLLLVPRQELAAELATELEIRQQHKKTFFEQLEEEARSLKRYQELVALLLRIDTLQHRCITGFGSFVPKFLGISPWILNTIASHIQVSTFFYIDQQLIEAVAQRETRLCYIKQLAMQ